MSALDELQRESPVNNHYQNRLTSPDTSTPKTTHNQRTRASLSTMYRLSGTCYICLEEKADIELRSHSKCGTLFCRQCQQVRATTHELSR